MHHRLAYLFFVLVLPFSFAMHAQAQSSCSSDGQATSRQLHERFISADCADCWGASPPNPTGPGDLVLDWIVPSPQGEEAPLSAAANREALERLAIVKAQYVLPSAATTSLVHAARRSKAAHMNLRVAHGLPVNDYLGTSLSLEVPQVRARFGSGALTAWLALVETIPAGSEGTPVERNLVRGVWITPVDLRSQSMPGKQNHIFESRAMRIPQGAQAERLRVAGWLQDASGKLLVATQSRCPVNP